MRMRNEDAYDELAKLSQEIIDAQENEDEKRYWELNKYLVALHLAMKLLSDPFSDQGIHPRASNPFSDPGVKPQDFNLEDFWKP